MSDHAEKVVLSLIERLNANDNEAVLASFADNPTYRVNAWSEPLVGIDAITQDFDRQHALWSDLRIKLVNLASTDSVVFTERIDTVHMMGRDIEIHMAGLFEVDDHGGVASWCDYFDTKEIESQFAN